MAMFVMFCSAFASAETALKKRPPASDVAFNTVTTQMTKVYSDILVEAFANSCTDAKIATAIKTHLKTVVTIFGIKTGTNVKLNADIQAKVKVAFEAVLAAAIKDEFTLKFKYSLTAFIVRQCPKKDAACIRRNAKKIVKMAAKLTVEAAGRIVVKVQAKLAVEIEAAIKLAIKLFLGKSIFIRVSFTGYVKVSAALIAEIKAAVGLCAKACAAIQVKEISTIKTICSA
ncbi:hypothetical protein BGZ54_004747 [Gamsiella multidivaricata]|nr:hypothetical protein BGZ54_004747 [Gamsiella multidivaricata]